MDILTRIIGTLFVLSALGLLGLLAYHAILIIWDKP